MNTVSSFDPDQPDEDYPDDVAVHPDELRESLGEVIGVLWRISNHVGDSDDPDAIAKLLVDLTNLHSLTGEIKARAEDHLVSVMPFRVEVPGAVFERHHKSPKRTDWDNVALRRALRPVLVFDQTGVERAGTDTLKQVETIWNLAGYNARKTALQKVLTDLGHEPSEFCHEEPVDGYELKRIKTEDAF